MIVSNIPLNQFIQPSLTCSQQVAVGQVLDLIGLHPGQTVVLVDEREEPLGVVSLSHLVAHLQGLGLWNATASRRSRSAIAALQTPVQALGPTILRPLTLIPPHWTVKQLLEQVRSQPLTEYGVVDSTGQLLGILDGLRLLQQLGTDATEAAVLVQPTSPSSTSVASHQFSQPSEVRSASLALEAMLLQAPQSNSVKASVSASLNLALFHSWVELLERLPLPVMLQTSDGQVLVQNSLWRNQVAALSDPAYLRQEAAIWLDGTQPAPIMAEAVDSSCHLGSTPGTCVCVCTLKDGQEQVLQFVRIPLGTLLPNWQVNWNVSELDHPDSIAAQQNLAPSIASPTFRLGTLLSKEESELDITQPTGKALWLVLAQDLTEQQHLAQELTAKNADLIQLNRLKDEFLACISHELKTPLTAVLGLSTLLKDQSLGELNNRQVRYAQLIYQSSRHLMAMVNDILDLTRIETGQLDLLFEPVKIQTVCNRAFEQAKQVRILENKTGETLTEDLVNAQFTLEIEPGLDLLVADEIRLRQMLLNLLSNALKFTEIGRSIGLKVSHWGGWIAFTVWDSGIGIAAEKQHLVFQKFQQLENPLTRQFEGAGLGLVLTRRLARLHGGDVTFLSQEGKGSQFTILLPPVPPEKNSLSRSTQDSEEELAEWTAEYPGGRVSLFSHSAVAGADSSPGPISAARTEPLNRLVLLVETAPPGIELLTDQLNGSGYQVVVARSGTEAIEKARRLQPCVILLNPVLPLLSGSDVLTLLKSKPDTQLIPVILTASEPDPQRSDRIQANGYLSLPVSTVILQQTLQQVLNSATSPISATRSATTNPTILYFHCTPPNEEDSAPATLLTEFLQQQHFRILESDDLEQADLLARVWRPKIILLERALANPTLFLEQFKHYPGLMAIPLVTLDAETTRSANQISGLQVFPCLAVTDDAATTPNSLDFASVLQVIQVALGSLWHPSILAIDPAALSLLSDASDPVHLVPPQRQEFPQESEWLQALMQYLQTAGYRGLLGQSWQEVLHQVQSQSVDLLLICWTDAAFQPSVLEKLAALQSPNLRLPVVVLDHRESDSINSPLPEVIAAIATEILTPPIAMSELLSQIHQALGKP